MAPTAARAALLAIAAMMAVACGSATDPVADAAILRTTTLSADSVQGGGTVAGTVTLDGAAPAGGASVQLGSNQASAMVPQSVTVAAGLMTASFTVTTTPVGADATASITATLAGASRTAILVVTAPPPALLSVGLAPASLYGGANATGTVTLSRAAPTGGVSMALVSNSGAAAVPLSVTVTAGAVSAAFTAATSPVATNTTATITASYAGVDRTVVLAVLAPVVASISVAPSSVQGGSSATGTVGLTGAAPAGGVLVSLSSSSSAAVVPGSVAVASGSTSASFPVTTTAVNADATAMITASHGGASQAATLTITRQPPPPAALSSVSLAPASVQGGTSSTGTVTLGGAAPSGGAAIALSSSSPSATVPAGVTVAAGSTSVAFTVTTLAVAIDDTATITATLDGTARATTLTVMAPDPCALRTPGAQWLAFSSKRTGTYQVWAMRDDGTCLRQVTHATADALFASWSPAGTIVFMSAQGGSMQVYVRDFTSGAEHRVDVGALTATSPAFSPDGQSLAFEGYEPGVTAISDVYVIPAAGGTPVKLTTGQRYSAGPAWSPDGATIYFVSNRVSGYNVWTVPAAGGPEAMIAGTAGILGRPAATPDGLGLAYTLSASGAAFSQVVLQTLSSGAIRMVTNQKDAEPAFNRSGDRMVVTSQRGGDADLLLLDTATGAVVRQLTTDPSIDGLAAYGPFP